MFSVYICFGEAMQPAGFAEGNTSPTLLRPGSCDLVVSIHSSETQNGQNFMSHAGS